MRCWAWRGCTQGCAGFIKKAGRRRAVAPYEVAIDETPIWLHNESDPIFGAKMATLSIKEVPEAWAEALRQRAARNHRSLQGELMALVEKAVCDPPPLSTSSPATSAGRISSLDRFGSPVIRRGNKTVEEIGAEHRKRFPRPIVGAALAVDIVRADRDAR